MPVSARGGGRSARMRYLGVSVLLLVVVALLGGVLSLWMTKPVSVPLSQDSEQPATGEDFDRLFRMAVGQMQRGEYRQALDNWHKILLINPEIPEVKVNMGFALFETGQVDAAREFFISAIEQNAYQANAYYGLALVSEKAGDLEGAMGAMRSYIHLAGEDADQRHIRRARSALWEWESQLSRQQQESGADEKAEPSG